MDDDILANFDNFDLNAPVDESVLDNEEQMETENNKDAETENGKEGGNSQTVDAPEQPPEAQDELAAKPSDAPDSTPAANDKTATEPTPMEDQPSPPADSDTTTTSSEVSVSVATSTPPPPTQHDAATNTSAAGNPSADAAFLAGKLAALKDMKKTSLSQMEKIDDAIALLTAQLQNIYINKDIVDAASVSPPSTEKRGHNGCLSEATPTKVPRKTEAGSVFQKLRDQAPNLRQGGSGRQEATLTQARPDRSPSRNRRSPTRTSRRDQSRRRSPSRGHRSPSRHHRSPSRHRRSPTRDHHQSRGEEQQSAAFTTYPRPQGPSQTATVKSVPNHSEQAADEKKKEIEPPVCAVCGDQHFTASCRAIMDLAGRVAAVDRNGHCRRCLWPGHRLAECNSGRFCRRCGSGTHHQALCPLIYR